MMEDKGKADGQDQAGRDEMEETARRSGQRCRDRPAVARGADRLALGSLFLYLVDLRLPNLGEEVAPVAAGDDEVELLQLRVDAHPLSKRSAFRGSFGLNQTQDRQFSYCQVIRFRLLCGSGSWFETMRSESRSYLRSPAVDGLDRLCELGSRSIGWRGLPLISEGTIAMSRNTVETRKTRWIELDEAAVCSEETLTADAQEDGSASCLAGVTVAMSRKAKARLSVAPEVEEGDADPRGDPSLLRRGRSSSSRPCWGPRRAPSRSLRRAAGARAPRKVICRARCVASSRNPTVETMRPAWPRVGPRTVREPAAHGPKNGDRDGDGIRKTPAVKASSSIEGPCR